MAARSSDSGTPKGRGRKRFLVALGIAALLLILLVVLLPTLVSLGLGQGLIRSAIAKQINGTVELDDVGLGWFSSQRIDGLRIIDSSGREAANVSVTVNNSLLSLALGRAKPIDLTLSGSVGGQMREDGSISFSDLFQESPERRRRRPPVAPPKEPFRSSDLPSIALTIASLDVTLENLQHKQTLTLEDLTGSAGYLDPSQPITLKLAGKTSASLPATGGGATATPGSIDITGQVDRLFAADGSLTLRGASAKLEVEATGVPLPLLIRPATIETLTLKVASDDLTERVAIESEARGRIDGMAGESTLRLDGSVTKIIDGNGKPSLRAAGANFNADAANLPLRAGDVTGEVHTFTASVVSSDLTRQLDIAAQGAGVFAEGAAGGEAAAQPSDLTANLSIADPFTPEGGFRFALERISGSVTGRKVPSSLARMALANTPIDPERDLGPLLDVEATFPGGVATNTDVRASVRASKADAEVVAQIVDDRSIVGSKLSLKARKASPELVAALTQNRVSVDRALNLEIDLSSFRLPPVDDKTQTRPLSRVSASGTVKVAGPARIAIAGLTTEDLDPASGLGRGSVSSESTPSAAPGTQPATHDPTSIALDRIDLALDTPALGEYLHVAGTALIAGGKVGIDQRVTNLFDASGQLAAAAALPVGTVTIENLTTNAVTAFVPAAQRDLAREALRGGVSGQVTTSAADKGIRAAVALRTPSLTLNSNVLREDTGDITLDKTHAEAQVTPALMALLQKDSLQPLVLRTPAKVVADLETFEIPATKVDVPLFAKPLRARVTVSEALLERKPTLAQALSIPSLSLNLTVTDKPSASADAAVTQTIEIANGQATLRTADPSGPLATLAFGGSIARAGERITPNFDLHVSDFNTRAAEALLGQAPGAIAGWTGDTGSLEAHFESDKPDNYRARIVPSMPNLQGTFIASLRDGIISLSAETSKLVLAKEGLQARLNPPAPAAPAGPTQRAQSPQIMVENSVPVQMALKRCEFPLAMLDGAAFDPAKVNVDVSLTGGPLKFAQADGVKSSLSDLDVSLVASDISKGVRFAMTGKAEAIVPAPREPAHSDRPGPDVGAADDGAQSRPEPRTAEERREARREERRADRTETQPGEAATAPAAPTQRAGVVDVTGTLANLVSADGKLDLAQGQLQMTARVSEAPTAIADALADMQGLLVAAVGPMMNATFIADDFSANTGTLDAKIDTTNGHLEGLLRGREGSFRVNKNAPVKAQLEITPPLRDRLLYTIHPILADVRTTEQPLRAEIPTALAAIPADVSKLRAEMTITIGKVEFDAGSTTMQIFALFGAGGNTVIPGEIEPIRAQIRNGIVTYDKFTVHIDKYTLNYSGQVDLVNQTADVRTEIPLAALRYDIKELRDYADTIVVPLVTRGKFGELKTTIDPDFDLGKAALEAGFKGTLGEFLKGADGLFKDLFDKPKNE